MEESSAILADGGRTVSNFCFDRRPALRVAVGTSTRSRDARGVTDAEPDAFGLARLDEVSVRMVLAGFAAAASSRLYDEALPKAGVAHDAGFCFGELLRAMVGGPWCD